MAASPPPLILCALGAELRALRPHLAGLPARCAVTGMGPVRAASAARRLAPGASLLVSTGCCGGLREARPGLLLIPDEVLGETGPAPAPDPRWVVAARETATALRVAHGPGPLLTVAEPLCDPEEKRSRGRRTGAAAVDMETAAVAAVAAELRIPYLCVRVLLDGVDERLPRVARGRDLASLAVRPGAALTLAALALRLGELSDALGRVLSALLRSGPPR